MGLLETLERKIPEKEHNKFEYGMLLAFAEQNKIRTMFGLKRKLDEEIIKIAKFLAENRTGSCINRVRREYARRGAVLQKIKDMVVKYL